MAKAPAYDLSDAEKRDLIQLLQAGRALPDRYRFVLFEDKREVELVWNGKSADVCTTVLPFQTLEHIDEPRAETKAQEDLFDSRGRQHKGWTNKLIWGDNKLILSSLKAGALRRQIEDAGGLKLIYIDPPFDVGADFSMDIEIGGETFHKEPNLLEQIAYRDTWGRGADSFISMIWAVDFDYLSRREIIQVAVDADEPSPPAPLPQAGEGRQPSPPAPLPQAGEGRQPSPPAPLPQAGEGRQPSPPAPLPLAGEGGRRPGEGLFEERWTGGYIFENEWQSFRTRKNRELELKTAEHSYDHPGRYTVAVKVIDIFGNDTMTLVPVNVG